MLAVCMACVIACLWWFWLVSFISFTTLENEEGEFEEEAYFNSCYYQDQDQHLNQGKPSWCLLLEYLSLFYHACFTSEDLQNLITKTIYEVDITTINII